MEGGSGGRERYEPPNTNISVTRGGPVTEFFVELLDPPHAPPKLPTAVQWLPSDRIDQNRIE